MLEPFPLAVDQMHSFLGLAMERHLSVIESTTPSSPVVNVLETKQKLQRYFSANAALTVALLVEVSHQQPTK